jgi:tRNA(fMet)-specific endonuclease VapC
MVECLLDTNACIAIMEGDATIERQLSDMASNISAIVLGELYFGAFNSRRVAANIARVAKFSDRLPLLTLTAQTSTIFGDVKSQLRKIGRIIPDSDIWIAASAMEHNLMLVTRDRHFENVSGLRTIGW